MSKRKKRARPEVRGRLTRRGALKVVVFDAGRVDGVGREHAAHWLRTTFAPRMGHETAYRLLWDGVPLPK